MGDLSKDRVEFSDQPCERCDYIERRARSSDAFLADLFSTRRDLAQCPSIDRDLFMYLAQALSCGRVRAIVARITDLTQTLCTVASCYGYFVFRGLAYFFREGFFTNRCVLGGATGVRLYRFLFWFLFITCTGISGFVCFSMGVALRQRAASLPFFFASASWAPSPTSSVGGIGSSPW